MDRLLRSRFVRSSLVVSALAAPSVGCAPPPLPPQEPAPAIVETPPPPPAPPPPAPIPAAEPLKLPAPVKFATGTARLSDESAPTLHYVVDFVSKTPELKRLRIEGHTDNRGDAASNLRLSEERALAVARWLVENGVACERLVPLGFGDAEPVADNRTEEGRALNRRTEFVNHAVVQLNGHLAGDPCVR